MSEVTAIDLVPVMDDLPGVGWVCVGDGGGVSTVGDAAELLDCVGPDFPDDEVDETASSGHFVRLPRTLVHGLAVSFRTIAATDRAEEILRRPAFAECLGRSVASDLEAQPIDAELLAIDVTSTPAGHRVQFTGGDERGIRPVHLDIVVVRTGPVIGLLWFGDTPEPFDPGDRDHVVRRISRPSRPERRPRP